MTLSESVEIVVRLTPQGKENHRSYLTTEAEKLLRSEQFHDLIVQSPDGTRSCHQALLVPLSPVLSSVLGSFPPSLGQVHTLITPVRVDTVENILKIIYTGKVTLTDRRHVDQVQSGLKLLGISLPSLQVDESRKRKFTPLSFTHFHQAGVNLHLFSPQELSSSSEDELDVSDGTSKKLPPGLSSLDLDGVIEYMKAGRSQNIIVMAGAGISTSAGIPDFRTPGTGLYDNLQKYNLPNPTAIFDINFFKVNPKPFFLLSKELIPGRFEPTVSHHFIKLLEKKCLLLRLFTQNIDGLEKAAKISEDKIVEAHGSFDRAHCIVCRKEYSQEWIKEIIFKNEVPTCEGSNCGGIVKPDIVFFGEDLPKRYYKCLQTDFDKCDLLIILGTSLVVNPFASLIDKVNKDCPRLLFNMEKAGMARKGDPSKGLQVGNPGNHRDVYWQGNCDQGCKNLAQGLGWGKELDKMMKK